MHLQDNALVSSDGDITLCDFGLARNDRLTGLESDDLYTGSIRWCSPELLLENIRDRASDIWAFGWLIWEVRSRLRSSHASTVTDFVRL